MKCQPNVRSETELWAFIEERRRIQRRRYRLLKLTLAAAVVVLLVSVAGGFAWWSASGSGAASASVGTLNGPSGVTAKAGNSSDDGLHGTSPVTVTWSAPGGGNVTPTGYYVTRYDEVNNTRANACGLSPASTTADLTCDDIVGDGEYRYTVTAVYHTWTATSGVSNTVHIVNDATPPTSAITFPSNNGSYNLSGWNDGCSTIGVCGTANDPGADASGVASVGVSIQRSSDSEYWNGTAWVILQTFNTATTSDSGAHWSVALPPSELNDGVTYTVTSKATDDADNVQSPLTTATFVYDTTIPSITVSHSANGLDGWNKTSPVSVSVAVSDASGIAAKPTCTVDSSAAAVSGTSSPYSVSVSGNATHPVFCSVSDNAGNSNTGNDSVKIDTTAPTGTALTTNPPANGNGWVNSTPVTVTLSGATDNSGGSGVAVVKYTTDSSDPTSSNTALTYNSGSKPTVSATTAFKYAAQDAAGNWETVHTSTVQVDTAAPTISVSHTADGAGGWNKTSPVSVSVTVSDGSSGVAAKPTCIVDGSAATVSGTSSPYTVSVTGDGTHPISCSVSDNAGNSNTGTDSLRIDTTSPSISVTHTADGLNGWNKTSSVSVSVAASDATSGVAAKPTCTVDGSAATVSGSSNPYSVSVTGAGTHPVSCSVSDNAGNGKSGTDSVKIDPTAPTSGSFTVAGATSTTGGATATVNNSTTLTLSARTDYTDGGSGLASSVLTVQSESLSSSGCGAPGSGGPFITAQTMTGTTQPSGVVAPACYVYILKGTDNAGNTASVSVMVTDNSVGFTITQQPASVIAGQATSGTSNVILTATKNGATDSTYTGATLTWSGANNSPSGTAPTLPTNTTWTSGQATFSITLVKAGAETLSVTDNTRNSGNFTPIAVSANTATKLAWTSLSTTSATGIPNPCLFTCTYSSGFGNNNTWNANVSITDSLGNTVSGVGSGHNVTVTLSGAGNGTITGGSPATLTMPSAGVAQSSNQVQFKGGTGNSWSNTITATASGFSSATASFSK